MTRRSSLLGNLALATATVLLFLTALEGVARLARRNRLPGKEAGTIALYTEHDPLLGWRKKPSARATFVRPEYTVEVVINSRGLRDRERDYEALPGTFRVLALGDSFIEAYSVPLEATATSVLEGLLAARGCPAEVINGGTAAYSTDQEYLFYRTEGVRYSPSVVVLFFYFNDVLFNGRDSYFGSPKPLFGVSNGDLTEPQTIPQPPPPPPRKATTAPAAPATPEGSALLSWLQDRLETGAPGSYNALSRFGLWAPLRSLEPPTQLKVYKRRLPDEIEKGWVQTDAILGGLARDVRAKGARLMIAYIPSRMEVNDRDWELNRIRYTMDDDRWDRGLVQKRLREMSEKRGIPVLDLTPALRQAERGVFGGPYYNRDGHWNSLGNEIAAREVDRFLTERGWTRPCAGAAPRSSRQMLVEPLSETR